MADLSFTVKGYIEVWLGTVKVSQHSSEREAIASAQRHANAAKKDGTYTLKYPSVEMRVIGVRASITDTTKPTAPVLQSVVGVNEDTVRLTWTASVDLESGVNGYQAFRDGVPVPGTTQSTTLDVAGQPYANATWTVVATDNAGNSSDPSNAVVGKPLDQTGPTAPTISATSLSSSSIGINLLTPSTDARSGFSGYYLERSLDGASGWTEFASALIAANFQYPDTGRSAATQYFYRGRGRDVDGNYGPYSAVVNATTAASGGVANGQGFTVTSAGLFGTPTGPIAPIVADTGGTIGATPTGFNSVQPSACTNPDHNTKYRPAPYTNPYTGSTISAPHPFCTSIIGGCHAEANANNGSTVNVTKAFAVPAFPYYVYASWLFRGDPNWVFNLGPAGPTQNDNNFKYMDYGVGTAMFTDPHFYLSTFHDNLGIRGPNDWYQLAGPTLEPTAAPWPGSIPDANGHGYYWDGCPEWNPFNNTHGWGHLECEFRMDTASTGYLRMWINGISKVRYAGVTEGVQANTSRQFSFGSYARNRGQNEYVYIAEPILQLNRCRVVVGNSATPPSPTRTTACIMEYQIPASWGPNTIVIPSLRRGRLSAGTNYIWVQTEAGVWVSGGTINIG